MNFKQNKFAAAYMQLIKQAAGDVESTEAVSAAVAPVENTLKTVSFVTSDPVLIDALNSGFEEAVFFTNCKNEATGEDDICEVKFTKESFGPFTIVDAEEKVVDAEEKVVGEEEQEEIEDEQVVAEEQEDFEQEEVVTEEDEELEDEEI